MNTQLKKTILAGVVISLLLVLVGAQPGYAQTPTTPLVVATAIPLEQSPPGIAEVTFLQLGQETIELRPPIAQRVIDIAVPYRWDIVNNQNFIELHYSMQHDLFGDNLPENYINTAVLEVYFNDKFILSVTPDEGLNQTLTIPIPQDAVSDIEDNEHQLRFIFFAGDCDYDQELSPFIIYDTSFIHFEYEQTPLEINLADFPRPLVQELFTPEPIVIIIPDEYSDADLSAAAAVAATLGQRAFGEITLDMITAAEATPEKLANASTIIVGQPQDNAFLLDLYQRNRLPTTLTDDNLITAGPSNQNIDIDDGVIQEVISDYSEDHVYLVVTGGSDLAVTRAAQTLSVLEPRYGFDGNLVVVADFKDIIDSIQPVDTFTLAELGFKDTTFYGIGEHTTTMSFFLPANWEFTDTPVLDLSYIHTNLLQSGASGLTVKLNDKPVGSAPINELELGERNARIELPKEDFNLGGRNRLTFEAVIEIDLPECILPELNLAWIRINETSQLYLPHIEVEDKEVAATLDDPFLKFATQPDLNDVWFSLPETPSAEELAGLINTAMWMGNYSGGPGFAPTVSQGAVDNATELDSYHVTAFGLPTQNPVIEEINDALPQPFVPGENSLRQEVGNVVYRLPNNFDIGLLQILPSPWNAKKVILVATGTSEGTENLAIDTLTNEDTYYELWGGNIAYLKDESIELFDSNESMRGALSEAVDTISEADETVELEVVPPTPVPTPETVSEDAKVEMPQDYTADNNATLPIALIIGLIVVGLIVVGLGIVLSKRRSKSS